MAAEPNTDRLSLFKRRKVVAPVCVLGAFAVLVGGALALGAFGVTGRAAGTSAGGPSNLGCTLTESTAGYPDRYITHRLPYKVHPPLPVSGWHGDRALAFDVLFH